MSTISDTNKSTEITRKRVRRLGTIGGALTGGGGAVVILLPMLVNAMLNWQLVFKEGNLFTAIWQDIPVPVLTNLYFWNLENPEEFQNGAKPRFREMGPYAYTTYLGHEIIRWGQNGESVHFYMKLRWEFNEEKTLGSRNDKLTILNPTAYATGGLARNILDKIPFSFTFSPIVFGFLNAFLYAHGEGVIKRTTVGGLIEGEYMGLVGTADIFIKPLKWLDLDVLRPIIHMFETRLAKNKFGLLHAVNNTKIGPYEVWSGTTDHRKFDSFKSFWGQTSLDHWDDPYCNMINGTQGLWFGSYLSQQDKLYMFFGEMGRPLYLTYKGMSFHRGVTSWRYRIPPAYFASPDKNPDNHCFCSTPKNPEMCDGIYDLGTPFFGAPAAISLPHLLYANPKIQSTVEGQCPDPDKHDCYFDILPAIGSPVHGNFRVQTNLLVKPLPLMFGFGDLPETVYPFLWVELKIEMEGILDWLLKINANMLVLIETLPYVALFSGMGVLGYTGNIAFNQRKVLFDRFKPKEERAPSIPIEPNYAIDRQTEAKTKQLYPNLFTISENGGLPLNPPRYNDESQRKLEPIRRSSPLSGNDIEQGQPRVRSPPGVIE